MGEAEFLQGISCRPEEAHIVLAIRSTIALICGVDAEFVHPTDDPDELRQMMDWQRKHGWLWDSYHGTFDPWEFKVFLEKRTDREFRIVMERSDFEDHLPPFGKTPARFWKGERPRTFGEWAADAASIISRLLEQPWPLPTPEEGGQARL